MGLGIRKSARQHTLWASTVGMGWLALVLASCSSPATYGGFNDGQTAAKSQVLATSGVLCDVTRQVAGQTVVVTCLLPPGADLHTYRPTPQDAKAIANAQVVFYNGYNYEGSLIKTIQSASPSITKIAVAEKAVPQPLLIKHDEHDHEANSADKGKEQPEATVPDPHVWQDVRQVQQMTQVVETTLGEKFPQYKATYASNSQKYQARLGKLDQWIRQQTATIPPNQRKLITTHHAFAYYAKAYGLTVEAALLGISTEEQATATRLQEIVKAVQQSGVTTIFAEASVNPKLMNAVAREAKVNLATSALFPEGTGNTDATGSYIMAMVANTNTIVTGLGGKITAFTEIERQQ